MPKPDAKINAFLKNFDLSDIEIDLYTGLLETGPTTVLELSKHVDIKRTTAHVNIENLIQKGFVAQTQKGARRKILAEPPEKLETILNNKKQKIKELEQTLPDVIDQINQTTIESTTKTSVRYYEGEEGFRKVSDRSIEKADKEICFISNLDEWYKIYSEEYDKKHYIPVRLEKDIRLKILTFETPLTRNLRKKDAEFKRETRFLPEGTKPFSTTTMIYDKEVSIMISSSPYLSVIIESKEIHDTFESLYLELEKISH
ncbi:hypothetical protein JW710_03430 [Candidatus Dojkabacteria bacterium]|nr:hypothetical protein [Candidatus Dojkabacteria bacterium]